MLCGTENRFPELDSPGVETNRLGNATKRGLEDSFIVCEDVMCL